MRIMFAGPSGIGKTTLAKYISDIYQIPYISGSVSNLIKDTASLTHKEMLQRSPNDLAMEDWQIMVLRNKLFKNKPDFVTDRSYVDLAAYYWYKQDKYLPNCEIENFFGYCKTLMESQCDLLIFCPLNLENIKDWSTEDNKKRITNNYFQVHISNLMSELLGNWEIPTLVLQDVDYNIRISTMNDAISKFPWPKK